MGYRLEAADESGKATPGDVRRKGAHPRQWSCDTRRQLDNRPRGYEAGGSHERGIASAPRSLYLSALLMRKREELEHPHVLGLKHAAGIGLKKREPIGVMAEPPECRLDGDKVARRGPE